MKCLKCGNNLELYKNNVLVCTYCYARFKVSDKQLEKHKSESFSAVDFSKPRPNCQVVNPLEENKKLLKNKIDVLNEEEINKTEKTNENNLDEKILVNNKNERNIKHKDSFNNFNTEDMSLENSKKHKNKFLLFLIMLLLLICLGLISLFI